MTHFFPEEVVTEILLRLPVKSVVRCTSVCKSWHGIITSSIFISTHLSHRKCTDRDGNRHPSLLLRLYSTTDKKELCSIHLDNKSFEKHQEFEYPFRKYEERWGSKIVGSCNGLLCLADSQRGIILWNPLIKRSITLPTSCSVAEKSENPPPYLIGFGHDSQTDDYKVLKVSYTMSTFGYNIHHMAYVYSLKTGLWKKIDAKVPNHTLIETHRKQVLLNGHIHWIGFNNHPCYLISTFNIGGEEFGQILLPNNIIQSPLVFFSIASLGGLLSVVHYGKFIWNISAVGVLTPSMSIWSMREYGVVESWTKQICVDFQEGLPKSVGMPLWMRENGHILLITNEGKLVSYCPKTNKPEFLGLYGIVNHCYVDSYVESLVLLQQGKVTANLNECIEKKVCQGKK